MESMLVLEELALSFESSVFATFNEDDEDGEAISTTMLCKASVNAPSESNTFVAPTTEKLPWLGPAGRLNEPKDTSEGDLRTRSSDEEDM